MASITYSEAASAFELDIAGTILPAISLILNKVSSGIEKHAARRFAAELTNCKDRSSSFEKVS